MLFARRVHGVSVAATLSLSLLACHDSSDLVAPAVSPQRILDAAGSASRATKTHFEVPSVYNGPLNWVSCVDPSDPPYAHVVGNIIFDVVTTGSGVVSTRWVFDIDRDQTWVTYKGVTYRLAPGREGHDDIVHILDGPDGLYVEAGTEPDFLAADGSGKRLRLNFHWQIVIDPGGTVRVQKSTGSCPLA